MTSKKERKIQGKVIGIEGNPHPHSFWIKGDDDIEYFAHLGDLFSNSNKLLYNTNIDTEFLKVDDLVEFIIWEDNKPRAFNVKSISPKK